MIIHQRKGFFYKLAATGVFGALLFIGAPAALAYSNTAADVTSIELNTTYHKGISERFSVAQGANLTVTDGYAYVARFGSSSNNGFSMAIFACTGLAASTCSYLGQTNINYATTTNSGAWEHFSLASYVVPAGQYLMVELNSQGTGGSFYTWGSSADNIPEGYCYNQYPYNGAYPGSDDSASACNGANDITLQINGSAPVAPPDFGNTRITTVFPVDGQTGVSSTSPVTLEALGYVNPKVSDLSNVDNKDGLQVKWNVYSNAQKNNCIDVLCILGGAGGVAGTNYYSGTGYGVFSSPYFDVSTTTTSNLSSGYYTLTTSIIMPNKVLGLSSLFGISFGQTTLVSTTTSFVVGTPTAAQTYLHDVYTATQAGVNNLTATSSAVSLSSCNPFSLDLGLCLAVLFFPDQGNLQNLVQFSKDNFLSRAPWGYATRLVTILTDNATSTATSTLPAFTVAFASSSPLYGTTITFDMEDMIQGGAAITNSLVDPISGKSFRDITEPFIQLFIALSVLIIIFHDLMSMGEDSNARSRGEGGSSNANPDKYREWLYEHRK